MSECPSVSILIICYNAQNYIEECLNSVLNQDFLDYELVICDDHSQDKTMVIINKLLNKTAVNFRIYQQEKNVGSFLNMKTGLSLCKGTYIAYLEGDDYWINNNKLTMQMKALSLKNEISAVVSQSYRLRNTKYEKYREVSKNMFFEKDLYGYTPFHSSTLVFRKDYVPKLPNYFKNCFSNDKFLYIVLSSQKPIYFLDEITSVYRMHAQNISSQTPRWKREWGQALFLLKMNRMQAYRNVGIIGRVIFKNHALSPSLHFLKKYIYRAK